MRLKNVFMLDKLELYKIYKFLRNKESLISGSMVNQIS